jgi:phosphoesterase RecJ-like protein
VGGLEAELKKFPNIINIDHHPTNTQFGQLNLIDTSACATAEIVYALIKQMGVCVTKSIAMSIYTGILTDTGSFRFANTNENAFSICKEMVEYGVDPSYVAQHVYGPYSLGRLKLLNRALDSIEISENGKLSVMTLTQEMFQKTGAQLEDTDGFLNYARNIKDIKMAALIQEKKSNGAGLAGKKPYHISLRSDGAVDVAAIAAEFGGGGHRSASGFCMESSLKKIKSTIFKLAEII